MTDTLINKSRRDGNYFTISVFTLRTN